MVEIREDVMVNPAWYVVAWVVVAAAAAWKFWRITGVYRSKIRVSTPDEPQSSLSNFKERLERSWQRDEVR